MNTLLKVVALLGLQLLLSVNQVQSISCYTGAGPLRVKNKCDDPQVVNCIRRTTLVGGISQYECGTKQMRESGCVKETIHEICYCDQDFCNSSTMAQISSVMLIAVLILNPFLQ